MTIEVKDFLGTTFIIGKIISYEFDDEAKELTVIFENDPENTHKLGFVKEVIGEVNGKDLH